MEDLLTFDGKFNFVSSIDWLILALTFSLISVLIAY